MATTFDRTAQAKKAWETIRARKAGLIPPAPDKKTTSKDEQLERLRKMMASWLRGEPLPEQETIPDMGSPEHIDQVKEVFTPTETPAPEPVAETPAAPGPEVVTPKKRRSKKEVPPVAAEAPAPASPLDAVVEATEKGGRRKKAA
jgi:hypothetical protein